MKNYWTTLAFVNNYIEQSDYYGFSVVAFRNIRALVSNLHVFHYTTTLGNL